MKGLIEWVMRCGGDGVNNDQGSEGMKRMKKGEETKKSR